MKLDKRQLILLLALGASSCVGCADSVDTDPVAVDVEMTQEDGMESEIASAMAELSAEDRAAAEKQKTCPVGGEPLGSMGAPFKVAVEGRDVFLCCEGCKEALLENPEKYLAKLAE